MNFTHTELDMNAIANGYASIAYTVEGYWSQDPIRIYVNRKYSFKDNDYKWTIELNHSSGGYDDYDNIQRALNFADAMQHAAYNMGIFEAMIPEFEEAYQAKMDEYRQEIEAEEENKKLELTE